MNRCDGYWFLLRHGLGPGTLPNDVTILDHVESGWKDYVKLDRFLTTSELNYYDIKEACPPDDILSACNTANGFAADMSNCFSASYGGAFDVEDDMFFTREEIDELAENAADKLTSMYPEVSVSVSECYMNTNRDLHICYDCEDYGNVDVDIKFDFRKIQKPSDINKYSDEIVEKVSAEINDWISSCTNINGSDILENPDRVGSPEYREYVVEDADEVTISLTLANVEFTISEGGQHLSYADEYVPWASPDGNRHEVEDGSQNWYYKDTDIVIADDIQVSDDFDIIFKADPHFPKHDGQYTISCNADLVYDITFTDEGYWEQDYDEDGNSLGNWISDISSNGSTSKLNLSKSKISNVQIIRMM